MSRCATVSRNSELKRFRALHAIAQHPYFPLCSGRVRRQVEEALAKLNGDRGVRAEVKGNRDFRRTLRKEMLAGMLGEYQTVIREYKRIVDAVPESPVARTAEHGAMRVENQIEPAMDRIRSRFPRAGSGVRLR